MSLIQAFDKGIIRVREAGRRLGARRPDETDDLAIETDEVMNASKADPAEGEALEDASDDRLSEHQGHEPSMEEILASIRRIIADDQVLPLSQRDEPSAPHVEHEVVGAEAPARPPAPRPAVLADAAAKTEAETLAGAPEAETHAADTHAADAHEDKAADGEPSPAQPDAIPVRAAEPAGDRRPTAGRLEHSATTNATMPRTEPPVAHEPDEHEAGESGEAAGDAGHEPVRPLAAQAPEADPLLSAETGSSVTSAFNTLSATMLVQQQMPSVEDLVREMLRPMLKSWLDDNLPVIVERLVRAEIERVARGGR